jgi:Putative DNA-binding domain
MITLAERQSQFMASLLAEDADPLEGSSSKLGAGLAIYRNNYRTTLIEALRDTFKRTARWIGDDAFHQAAAHHVIVNPPGGWTLDDVGAGFDRTLAVLFAKDHEVSELAWIEWSMHRAFGAANAEPLTALAFAEATAGFGDVDWSTICLDFVPGIRTCLVHHDVAAIWHACDTDEVSHPPYARDEPLACHVYRDGEQPAFITAPAFENPALDAMVNGAHFGDILDILLTLRSQESAVADAGAMLGRWLNNGFVIGLRT